MIERTFERNSLNAVIRSRSFAANSSRMASGGKRVQNFFGLPLPGTVLTKDYKGRLLRVLVLDNGFEFEGARFQSLSAVAKAVTGSHTNGYLFFRLTDRGASS